jgi:hypothetical protein
MNTPFSLGRARRVLLLKKGKDIHALQDCYHLRPLSSLRTKIIIIIDFLNYIWSFILFKIFILIYKIINYV